MANEHLSPEARREWMVREIRGLCRVLNAAGSDPLWTPSRLRFLINETEMVTDGLNSLSFAGLQKWTDFLEAELVKLNRHAARVTGDSQHSPAEAAG